MTANCCSPDENPDSTFCIHPAPAAQSKKGWQPDRPQLEDVHCLVQEECAWQMTYTGEPLAAAAPARA